MLTLLMVFYIQMQAIKIIVVLISLYDNHMVPPLPGHVSMTGRHINHTREYRKTNATFATSRRTLLERF